MNTMPRIALAITAAALLTSCAKTDDSAVDTASIDTAAASMTPVPVPQPLDSPAAPAAGEGSLVHVPLSEWKVSVSESVVAPGTRTFHAMNQGTNTHAFEIEGNGEEWKSDNIPPGGTATLTPTLKPGTYQVYCPIVDSHGNHQQRGMRTTFRVQ